MNQNQENPKEKKTSRIAAAITIVILLCLVIAGGVFVLYGHFSLPAEKNASQEAGSSPDNSAVSIREWLGIDTILSILDLGNGYTVVKADPSEIASMAASSDEEVSGQTAPDAAAEGAGTAAADPNAAQADAAAEGAGTAAADPNAAQAGAAAADPNAAQTGAAAADPNAAQTGAAAADPNAAQAGAAAADPNAAQAGAAAADPNAGQTAAAADTAAAAAAKQEAAKKEEEKKKEEEEKKNASPTKLQKKYVNAWEERHYRDFPENFPLHNYNWKYLEYDESGILRYEGDDNYMIRRGIDVSEFQGTIDWDKVKDAGYDFVFVRVGHRTMHTGDLRRDNRAIKNLTRAKKAGLDVGAYVFSQAITKKEAREEAQLCLDVIEESGVELTLPIVFDPEIVVEDYNARINYISGEQFTDNCVAFCEKIKKAGYTPAVYANCSTETDILDMSRLEGNIIWYADYSGTPETPYDFTFWQYTNLGWVDGIPETETDLNVWFIEK